MLVKYERAISFAIIAVMVGVFLTGATTWLVPKNAASGELAAAIDSDDTTLVVRGGQGARFPSTYPFRVVLSGAEVVEVTNRSTDTFTITRAQESTSAASHAAGASVRLSVTAGYITQIQNAVTVIEGMIPSGGSFVTADDNGNIDVGNEDRAELLGIEMYNTGVLKVKPDAYTVTFGHDDAGHAQVAVGPEDSDGTFSAGVHGTLSITGDFDESNLPPGNGVHFGKIEGAPVMFCGTWPETLIDLYIVAATTIFESNIQAENIGTGSTPDALALNDTGASIYQALDVGASNTRAGQIDIMGGTGTTGGSLVIRGGATGPENGEFFALANNNGSCYLTHHGGTVFRSDSDAGTFAVEQDILADGGDIGITEDKDLLGLSAGKLSIRGDLALDANGIIRNPDGDIIMQAYVPDYPSGSTGALLVGNTIYCGGPWITGNTRSGHMAVFDRDDGDVAGSFDWWNSPNNDDNVSAWSALAGSKAGATESGRFSFIGMKGLVDKVVWQANETDRSMTTGNGLTVAHEGAGSTAKCVFRLGSNYLSTTEGEEYMVIDQTLNLAGVKSIAITGIPSECIITSVQAKIATTVVGSGDLDHLEVGTAAADNTYGATSSLTAGDNISTLVDSAETGSTVYVTVSGVNSGGSLCDTNITSGTVRVVARYRQMNPLD